MTSDLLHKKIITYYQSSQWMYRMFVYDTQTLGMHHGFWYKNTKNRQKAIINENQEVVVAAQIRAGQRILDAGCGVGGTALYIAQKTKANVCGISLDPKQIALAQTYAQKRGLTPLTHFSVQDYTHTNFPNNYFNVVYGIESICHADPKSAFLKEAYRILKPGGKLIILDGYTTHEAKTFREKQILSDFTSAWALPPMTTNKNMEKELVYAGFIHINSKDFTHEVLPTIQYFRMLGAITGLICTITKYIPIPSIQAIYKNYAAFKAIAQGYDSKLASYWKFCGQKPLKKTNRKIPIKRAKQKK